MKNKIPAGVVAIFFNPATGKPRWQKDPPPGYKERGSGEFYQFKGEFPFTPVEPTDEAGPKGESLRQAIKKAQALYWILVAPK